MDIDGLIKSANNLAELTGNISFVTQSNSLRRTSKEKAKELKTLDNKSEEKLQALKNCQFVWYRMIHFVKQVT